MNAAATRRIYRFSQAAQFSDVDMGGVLYHARYLDYFDRARQAMLEHHGLSFAGLFAEGVTLVVTGAEVRYRRPIVFGDTIQVSSRLIAVRSRGVAMEQWLAAGEPAEAPGGEDFCCAAQLELVCFDLETRKAMRFPPRLADAFAAAAAPVSSTD